MAETKKGFFGSLKSSKEKEKTQGFDYHNCNYECRLKKKKMIGTKIKYVYIQENIMIICNVISLFEKKKGGGRTNKKNEALSSLPPLKERETKDSRSGAEKSGERRVE